MGGSAEQETREEAGHGPLSLTIEGAVPGGTHETPMSLISQAAQSFEETAPLVSGEGTQQAAPSTSYDPTLGEGEMECK